MKLRRLTGILCKIALLTGVFLLVATVADAQCSICTKTAQQLGEKPAKGLNFGILYLALTPFLIAGVIGYFFWRRNRT